MFEFMKCVVEAVVANGVQGLLAMVPGGPYVYQISADSLRRYRERNGQKRIENEVKEMIVAKADIAIAAAKQALEEGAPKLPPREKDLVLQFISAMPEAARQSLKRNEDVTGKSLPPRFEIREVEDLVKLLPQHPPRFLPGEWVPGREHNWRLERRLGGGGFGEVWLAHHFFKRSEKSRAVKFCTDPKSRAKLVQHEKDLIIQVMRHTGDHPNIVPLLECDLNENMPWLMYEYVDGNTLTDTILDSQVLSPAQRMQRAIDIIYTISSAIGHCHTMDPVIVHRDLKPANILMERGIPRITDFGIGGTAVDYLLLEEKTRGYASVKGRLPTGLNGSYTLMYSSPQQRSGERPDPRDDVHALGVIAYQMLIGRVDAEVRGNWHKRLKHDGVPEALIELIGNSTSNEIDDRPKDACEWQKTIMPLLPTRKWWRKTESVKRLLPCFISHLLTGGQFRDIFTAGQELCELDPSPEDKDRRAKARSTWECASLSITLYRQEYETGPTTLWGDFQAGDLLRELKITDHEWRNWVRAQFEVDHWQGGEILLCRLEGQQRHPRLQLTNLESQSLLVHLPQSTPSTPPRMYTGSNLMPGLFDDQDRLCLNIIIRDEKLLTERKIFSYRQSFDTVLYFTNAQSPRKVMLSIELVEQDIDASEPLEVWGHLAEDKAVLLGQIGWPKCPPAYRRFCRFTLDEDGVLRMHAGEPRYVESADPAVLKNKPGVVYRTCLNRRGWKIVDIRNNK